MLVEAIVEAGTRILVRQGREALNTNSVAAVAGVSIGSLYQYFPNREAIIAAVAERHAQQICDCMTSVDIAAHAKLDDAIAAIVDALFDSHFLDPSLHIALVHDLEPRVAQGERFDSMTSEKSAFVAQLTQLPHHFEDCAVDGDLARAAFVIAEMTHALAHAAINPNIHPYSVDDLKSEAVRVSQLYLRRPPNRARMLLYSAQPTKPVAKLGAFLEGGI